MPSYHQKESNPSLVFRLGGEDENDYINIYIDIDITDDMDTNIVLDSNITKYKIKSYKFINSLIVFIRNIFLIIYKYKYKYK